MINFHLVKEFIFLKKTFSVLVYFRSRVRNFFGNKNERTLRLQKNIVITFLVRGASIFISLILIPLTITYITPMQYGIWLTTSSVIAWISNFDVGLGNGLKNKIAYSLAIDERQKIKKYVSTTYAIMLLISLSIFLIFLLVSSFYNWNDLLNLPSEFPFHIKSIIVVILVCFCLQFVLQIINSILTAIHQPFKSSIILLIGQLLVLISVYLLIKYVPPDLFTLVLVLAGLPVLVLLVANIYLFETKLKDFAPSLKNIDLKSAKNLLNVGVVFFFIQLGALVLYQTDNIIIAQIMGTEAVTTFNVSYKLFQVIIIFFSIILTPYWSAFTDAYAKNDFAWIKTQMRNMRLLWLAISVISLLVFVVSDKIYSMWLGDTILVSGSLSLAMALYVIAVTWHYIHIDFINGVGKIKLQLILITSCAIINIPLAIILCKTYGLAGVISANTIAFIIMGIVFFFQSKKIINQTATKIWNK